MRPAGLSSGLEQSRPRYGLEIVIVLGLSLGRSAVYSVLSIIEKLTRPEPLSSQRTTMNSSAVPDRPWLDLSYQFLNNLFPLVTVVLVCYLLWVRVGPAVTAAGAPGIGPWKFDPRPASGLAALGLSREDLVPKRLGRDALGGLLLAAVIGIPGLALYLGAQALGFNTTVAPANLADNWWTIPILIFAAFQNGALEEIVMIGYVFTRLRQKSWHWVAVLLTSALVRGSYHLYQGFGGFVGNLIMGIIFGLLYYRFRRVAPLVIAHTLLDVAAFVGYALVSPHVSWL